MSPLRRPRHCVSAGPFRTCSGCSWRAPLSAHVVLYLLCPGSTGINPAFGSHPTVQRCRKAVAHVRGRTTACTFLGTIPPRLFTSRYVAHRDERGWLHAPRSERKGSRDSCSFDHRRENPRKSIDYLYSLAQLKQYVG
jgi:hypothetical protein